MNGNRTMNKIIFIVTLGGFLIGFIVSDTLKLDYSTFAIVSLTGGFIMFISYFMNRKEIEIIEKKLKQMEF